MGTSRSESAAKYASLASVIRAEVIAGSLPDNHLLPSERDLAEQYAVSRDTVRKMIRLLETEGIVYSAHGRGTFVSPAILRGVHDSIDGFSDAARQRGDLAGQFVLGVEAKGASLALASALGIRPGRIVTHVRRVRLLNRRPVGLHDAYVVTPDEHPIQRAELEQSGSIYATLRSRGVAPVVALDSVSAALAGSEEAALLAVEPGSPLLLCERVAFSDRRTPLEHCVMHYVPSFRFARRITAAFDARS